MAVYRFNDQHKLWHAWWYRNTVSQSADGYRKLYQLGHKTSRGASQHAPLPIQGVIHDAKTPELTLSAYLSVKHYLHSAVGRVAGP